MRTVKNYFHFAQAVCACMWYGFPGKKIRVIGITGTDGKTTTTHLIHHILRTAQKKAALVSSVYAEIGGEKYDTGFHVTTPNSFMLQKFLRQAISQGEEFMVLEVTSHGLDQNRVWGIDFEIGVLTNITHEHLDYHKTYENYLRAKEKLLLRSKIAIINRDDESYDHILRANPLSEGIEKFYSSSRQARTIITYGIKNDANIIPQKFPFTTSLPGEYNQYNCLAAIAATAELGIPFAQIKRAIKTFPGVTGRFEKISTGFGFNVIIDFAHTPNALEKVLRAVKHQIKGKVIHVFGSAGLRDQSKRPLMGKVSAKNADIIVLTEEDYRIENVDDIIEEISSGCRSVGAVELLPEEVTEVKKIKKTVVFKIPDRSEAIHFAITTLAEKNDTVLLTGKAHEKSLCRGRTEYPWSEHEVVKNALAKRQPKS